MFLIQILLQFESPSVLFILLHMRTNLCKGKKKGKIRAFVGTMIMKVESKQRISFISLFAVCLYLVHTNILYLECVCLYKEKTHGTNMKYFILLSLGFR